MRSMQEAIDDHRATRGHQVWSYTAPLPSRVCDEYSLWATWAVRYRVRVRCHECTWREDCFL